MEQWWLKQKIEKAVKNNNGGTTENEMRNPGRLKSYQHTSSQVKKKKNPASHYYFLSSQI